MWTANLDSIQKDDTNRNLVGSVTFTNNSGVSFTEKIPGNNLTPTTLSQYVGNRIQDLEIADAALPKFVLGNIVLPPKTPDQQSQLDALK